MENEKNGKLKFDTMPKTKSLEDNMHWNAIVTSILTSLVISSVTFIFGLRAGKNQADRLMLKEIYRKLYSHFEELFDSLDSARPKKWSDFKEIATHDGTKYLPLTREMKETGQILELNDKLAQRLIDIESKILLIEYNQKLLYEILKTKLLYRLKEVFGDNLYEEKHCISTSKDKTGKSYTSTGFGVFFSGRAFDHLLKRLNGSQLGVCFEYIVNRNSGYNIYIFSQDVKDGNLISILQELNGGFSEIDKVRAVADEKEKLLNDKDNLMKILKKKSRDPHSLWGTIFGAVKDLLN